MKKIFVVGGNGFARECAGYINLISTTEDIEFAGFLGHGGYGHTVDYKSWQSYYKGEVTEHKFADNEYVIIGAGYPDLRKKIYEDLKAMGLKFYNLILSSYIGSNVNLGEGNILTHGCSLSENIVIGNGNLLNGSVVIGHDVEIGNFNFFGPRSQILGEVKIGNSNSIGTNAIVLPHAKIGNNNTIAPLSAVYKGCRNNGYYLGNPALKVGDVE